MTRRERDPEAIAAMYEAKAEGAWSVPSKEETDEMYRRAKEDAKRRLRKARARREAKGE